MPSRDQQLNCGLYWLASYPKSGNTWLRAFLSNLLSTEESPISINSLNTAHIASSRTWLDEVLAFSTADLERREVLALRPYVYAWAHKEAKAPLLCKVHDANSDFFQTASLFSHDSMTKAVYVIRNPLDVVVSLANHLNVSISQAVNNICDQEFTLVENNLRQQVPQILLNWSQHVQSWVDQQDLNIHVIRYEDMHADAHGSFSKVASFLDIERDSTEFARAIRNSSFDVLHAQEEIEPFLERLVPSKAFFRSGRVGEWREVLSKEEVERVISVNRDVMIRFGYLDKV